ncbi:sigma-54-dependent transcriptional regulator [Shivajiella indica]|uniref:Sigma-54-dependent transcriptional regulator n=1 Tax=Shivajiella indica TaxID=872115 RepID=A0ABW5B8L7_9BACT
MGKILLIEDDISYSRIIKNFLEKNGFEIFTANKVSEGLSGMKIYKPDLVITDFRLPDGNGMQILESILKEGKNTKAILITSYSDIRIAVKAIKMGAVDYITKPINPEELLETVKEALEYPSKDQGEGESISSMSKQYVEGKSPASQEMEEQIQLVAPTDLNVLILGETGSGKEFVANKIHLLSKRKNNVFTAIDCGAIPKELAGSELFGHIKGSFTGAFDNKTGHFENSKGGTIFLDEVGNLSSEVQVMLLRAIQERKIRKIGSNYEVPIDVRIISATNENLKSQEKDASFREDLYHRLNEFSIQVPSLKERKEDLDLFIQRFIQSSNQRLGKSVEGIDPEVKNIFYNYSWPGNLRELKNVIRRAVLLSKGPKITSDLLPVEIKDYIVTRNESSYTPPFKDSLQIQEREIIQKALLETKYNKSKTAKLLGIDRKTLYNKMEKYGLN